jgi:Domain of unknown function (DUF4932)
VDRRNVLAISALLWLWPTKAIARQVRSIGSDRTIVDPRIELMSIVHLLGGYFLISEASTDYRRDALQYFENFRHHPAVARARRLSKGTLAFDAVPDLMVRLTNPDSLVWRTDLREDTPPGIPDADERQKFLAELRDFSRVSKFTKFFARHRGLYRRTTQAIDPMVAPNIAALETYTGGSMGDWKLITGPLQLDGGYGPRTTRKDGSIETYAVIGPLYNSVGEPDFGDYDRLQDLVVHEFAHSLINPLGEKYYAIVQRYADRFEPMREQMKKVGDYTSWSIVVDEHLVRAVTARIAAIRLGEAAGDKAVTREVERGFSFVPALIERLRQYEISRRNWPTLEGYYGTLMTAFDVS